MDPEKGIGDMIDLETARRIAYDWHGGGRSPLYSFASTSNDGPRNITRDTIAEVNECIPLANGQFDAGEAPELDGTELLELRDYLLANLPPVEHACSNGHAYQRQPGTVETCQVCGEPLEETSTP